MLQRLRIRNRIFSTIPAAADLLELYHLAQSFKGWRRSGLPVPAPHSVKRAMLLREAKRIGAEVFVETGTFTGDTVWFMRDSFRKIISVEVQPNLAALATERYSSRPHIKIVEGDSATALFSVMPELDGPTLFWLDGHYSAGITGRGIKDCPIYEELEAIANRPPHRFTIVIDDRRCFGTENGYPSWDELSAFVAAKFPMLKVETELDMIWCRCEAA